MGLVPGGVFRHLVDKGKIHKSFGRRSPACDTSIHRRLSVTRYDALLALVASDVFIGEIVYDLLEWLMMRCQLVVRHLVVQQQIVFHHFVIFNIMSMSISAIWTGVRKTQAQSDVVLRGQ